jgi:hypothetical protein
MPFGDWNCWLLDAPEWSFGPLLGAEFIKFEVGGVPVRVQRFICVRARNFSLEIEGCRQDRMTKCLRLPVFIHNANCTQFRLGANVLPSLLGYFIRPVNCDFISLSFSRTGFRAPRFQFLFRKAVATANRAEGLTFPKSNVL